MSAESDAEDVLGSCNVDSVRLQLQELELLQAMYEVHLSHPACVARAEDFVRNEHRPPPPPLEFGVSLRGVCVQVVLPTQYPVHCPPQMHVEAHVRLPRRQQQALNHALHAHLQQEHRGDLCLATALLWLQEQELLQDAPQQAVHDSGASAAGEKERYGCYWIYSHHIYSQEKRRRMVALARQLHLSGFCLPGKPGLVCVEGEQRNCAVWWQEIKAMKWQHISCKKTEQAEVGEAALDSLRRFQGFQELSFGTDASRAGRGHHSDMGQLLAFLQRHSCAHAFQEFFGMQGRLSSS